MLILLYNILNKLPITIWGDGTIIRDYLFIDDLVDALVKAGKTKIGDNNIFNISSGKGASLNKIISEIEKSTKQKANIKYTHSRKFDVPENILDNQLSFNYLKWKPFTTLQDGIQKTYKWITKVMENINNHDLDLIRSETILKS